MTKVHFSLINPRKAPFTTEVEDFWDDESTSVSTFTAGINNRDGDVCIIGNCGYNISAYLDCCHIIPKNDMDTVNISLSLSLIYLI